MMYMEFDIMEYPLKDLQNGFALNQQANAYCCLCCGKTYPLDEVYPVAGHYLLPERAAKDHVAKEHGGMLQTLLSLDKKQLALTENQRQLLFLMSQGKSDASIAAELGLSPSTIRHQRFTFREKAKQALAFLAVYELAVKGSKPSQAFVEMHQNATIQDDRMLITKDDEQRALNSAFLSLNPLKMRSFQLKEKAKLVALCRISKEFEKGRRYTEKEVNRILKNIFDDYATIRRYLIQYGFMDRTKDCREYWLL